MTKNKKMPEVFKMFRCIAVIFNVEDPDRFAFEGLANGFFCHSFQLGSIASVDMRCGFRDHARFEINWPGIGSKDWQTALAFGDHVAQLARMCAKAESVVLNSGISANEIIEASNDIEDELHKIRQKLANKDGVTSAEVKFDRVMATFLGQLQLGVA